MRLPWPVLVLALVLPLLAGYGLEGRGALPQEVTLRFYDPEDALGAVYYRLAGGAWQRAALPDKALRVLTPSPKTALEVAVECGPSHGFPKGQLLFVQGEAEALRELVLPCSYPRRVSVPVAVSFPKALGGTPLASTDFFTLDGYGFTAVVPGGFATLHLGFTPGPQKASLLVYRLGERSTLRKGGTQLLGGKVFDLVAEEGRTVLVALSERDTVASRVFALTAPYGGHVSAKVEHFRDGMRQLFAASPFLLSLDPGETGVGRYALFPGGGVYLGRVTVSYSDAQGAICRTGCSRKAFVAEDTRGLDWTPALPPPWPEGTLWISPDGRTWRLGFPGAKGYQLQLLFPDNKLLMVWTSFSELTLPDLAFLGFRYPTSGEVRFFAAALVRGRLDDDYLYPLPLSENRLKGLSYAASSLSGTFALGQGGSF